MDKGVSTLAGSERGRDQCTRLQGQHQQIQCHVVTTYHLGPAQVLGSSPEINKTEKVV